MSLDNPSLEIVYKMIQALTKEPIAIEKLSSEESKFYKEGFTEIEEGNYKTLQQVKAERLNL